MQGGSAPNAKQKRWLTSIVRNGCMVCGEPASVHHCVGTKGKHNKIAIGHEWIVPLCYEHHQGPYGIHFDLTKLQSMDGYAGLSRREIEKKLFANLVEMEKFNPELPDPLIIDTIMDYHT